MEPPALGIEMSLLVAVLTYHHLIIIIIIIVLATVNKCNCRVRQPFNKQPRDDRGDAAAVLLWCADFDREKL